MAERSHETKEAVRGKSKSNPRRAASHPNNLNLGIIGNCTIKYCAAVLVLRCLADAVSVCSIMVDTKGRGVWGCFPRFDSDPVFCDLISGGNVRIALFLHAKWGLAGLLVRPILAFSTS